MMFCMLAISDRSLLCQLCFHECWWIMGNQGTELYWWQLSLVSLIRKWNCKPPKAYYWCQSYEDAIVWANCCCLGAASFEPSCQCYCNPRIPCWGWFHPPLLPSSIFPLTLSFILFVLLSTVLLLSSTESYQRSRTLHFTPLLLRSGLNGNHSSNHWRFCCEIRHQGASAVV